MKKLIVFIGLMVCITTYGQNKKLSELSPLSTILATDYLYAIRGAASYKMSGLVLMDKMFAFSDSVETALDDSCAALRAYTLDKMAAPDGYWTKRTYTGSPNTYTLWPANTGGIVTRLQVGTDPGTSIHGYYFTNTGTSNLIGDVDFGGYANFGSYCQVYDSLNRLYFRDQLATYSLNDLTSLPTSLTDNWTLDAAEYNLSILDDTYGFKIIPSTGVTSMTGQNEIQIEAPLVYINDTNIITLIETHGGGEASLIDGITNNVVLARIGDSIGSSGIVVGPVNIQPGKILLGHDAGGFRMRPSSTSSKLPAYSFYLSDSTGINSYGTNDYGIMVNSKGDTIMIACRDSIYVTVPIKGSHGITGSGTPAGSTGSIQINSAGSFGSISGFDTTSVKIGDDVKLNVGFGRDVMNTTLTGSQNNAFGYTTMDNITSGDNNSGFGSATLNSLSDGNLNSGFGYNSLLATTTGSNNIGLGAFSGTRATAALSNRLYINSIDRTNVLGDTTLSIIYGYQSETTANQHLYFNANTHHSDTAYYEYLSAPYGSRYAQLLYDTLTDAVTVGDTTYEELASFMVTWDGIPDPITWANDIKEIEGKPEFCSYIKDENGKIGKMYGIRQSTALRQLASDKELLVRHNAEQQKQINLLMKLVIALIAVVVLFGLNQLRIEVKFKRMKCLERE